MAMRIAASKTIVTIALLMTSWTTIEAGDFPKGHLEPFGCHRPPEVDIDELYDVPDPQTFWDKYVSNQRAAILRGAVTHSPAFTKWTNEYLSEEYGDLEVRLEGKKERGSGIPVGAKGLGRDTIRSFLETYREKDTYIISQLPKPMYHEFYVPPCITCGTMRKRFVEIDLWMSSGNTHSIIHKDAFNAINCLLKGTKYWKLIEYKYEKYLYKTWEPKREIGGNSQVNQSSVDLLKYPDIAKIPWSNITINAGDCLFLPKSYYHQVSSYGETNLAVSVLFSRLTSFDNTGCNETVIDYTPLSEIDVLWDWLGHGVMSMGNNDVWAMQKSYEEYAKEFGQITLEDLKEETEEEFPEIDEKDVDVEAAWRAMDKTGKGFLTAEDIRALDTEAMRQHALAYAGSPEPSNTEEFEYNYIEPELIISLLDVLIETLPNGVPRNVFVSAYVKHLQGTEKYANEIFDGLTGPNSEVATVRQITTNLENAIQKFTQHQLVDSNPEIDNKYGEDRNDLFHVEL